MQSFRIARLIREFREKTEGKGPLGKLAPDVGRFDLPDQSREIVFEIKNRLPESVEQFAAGLVEFSGKTTGKGQFNEVLT